MVLLGMMGAADGGVVEMCRIFVELEIL